MQFGQSSMPQVSVVIPTRNRADALKRTLESFNNLDTSGISFELIVAYQDETDGTKEVLSAFSDTATFPVKYIYDSNKGINYARNCAARASSGNIILMTDDDCIVDENWLKNVAKLYSTENCQVIGGRVELFNENDMPVTIKTDLRPATLSGPADIFGFLHGANLAIGRSVFEKIGYFDIRFGAGTPIKGASETEFVLRAHQAGIPVRYDPSFVVHHDHGRNTHELRYRLERAYARATGALMAKVMMSSDLQFTRHTYHGVRSVLRQWHRYWGDRKGIAIKFACVMGSVRFLTHEYWQDPGSR